MRLPFEVIARHEARPLDMNVWLGTLKMTVEQFQAKYGARFEDGEDSLGYLHGLILSSYDSGTRYMLIHHEAAPYPWLDIYVEGQDGNEAQRLDAFKETLSLTDEDIDV